MKSKKPTYVTIRDVAKLADTSIATVSYVLNHPTGIRPISDELRERVVKAAEELGITGIWHRDNDETIARLKELLGE